MARPIIAKHLYAIGAYTHTTVGRLYRHILIQVKNQVVETELGTEICGNDLIFTDLISYLFCYLPKKYVYPTKKKRVADLLFRVEKGVIF